jgi:poly(beta-D-mannuronate) lyase
MANAQEYFRESLSRRNILVGFGIMGINAVLLPLPKVAASGFVKNYTSVEELQVALDLANAGDTLTLSPGTYADVNIVVSRSGLTISAQTPGTVIFNGASQVAIKADSTFFSGFQFRDGETPGILIKVSGSKNQLVDLNFSGYSAGKYINIESGSQYNAVLYCNFENKPVSAPIGNLVGVIPHEDIPGFHQIRFCSFKNLPGPGGDYGNEPIRLGVGAKSDFISRTIVENCYWENTGLGDSESISVKSRENVIRYCTFKNNQEGMLVFRNGNDNMAYGNRFIDSGGIRVKEASNIFCFDNYFENSGFGDKAGTVNFDYVPGNLQNINFLFNTFIDSAPISTGGDGASLIRWSNNLFSNKIGPIFQDVSQGTKWLGNIYQGSTGLNSIAGLKSGVLKFTKKFSDVYRPSSTSAARSAAVSGFALPIMYPGLSPKKPFGRDLFKTLRPQRIGLWDVGAVQYSKVSPTAAWVSSKTTGPRYL